MKRRSMFSKTLAAVLSLVMLIGLMPVTAMAAEGDTTTENNTPAETGDLYLDKTAVLQPDGTWTITLEAYATGVVKTEVRTQVTPTDIILVLDQSGSMVLEENNVTAPGGYTQVTSSVTNATLVNSSSYYHKVGNQYFRFNSEKVTVAGTDKYWEYYDAANATAKTTPEADPNNLINTSWAAGGSTYNFDTDTGYYAGQYMVYQLKTQKATGSIFGQEFEYDVYLYEYVADSSKVPQTVTPSNTGTNYTSNLALSALEDLWPGWSVTTSGDYAFVYLPATLKDDGYYYYRYYYTDEAGAKVYLDGTSETSAADPNVDSATYWGVLYGYQSGGSVTRLAALQSAATTFVNDITAASGEHQVDHRIAVVGFASDAVLEDFTGYNNDNTELFIGSTQYNYFDADNEQANGGALASTMYGKALQSVNTTEGYNNLIASINSLDGRGATYPSYGFLMAQGIAGAYANATADTNDYLNGTRKLVVVFMTDGEPGEREGAWDSVEATAAQNAAAELETTYGATVYTVAMLDNAPEEGENVDNFLTEVTSSDVTGTDGERYWLATDGVSLTNFFHTIEIEVDTTVSTVELTRNAYMVDRVSEHFSMPGLERQGTDESDDAYKTRVTTWLENYVTVYTAAYEGNDDQGNHQFAARVEQTDVTYDLTVSDPETDGKIHLWPTFSTSDNIAHGITVHNFNYLADANMVRTEGGVNKGRKLIVVIEGITAKDSAAQDIGVYTNNDNSGLWDMGDTGVYGMLKGFPMPTALVANRVYVLDYAKEALLDTSSSVRQALALDATMDKVNYTTENGVNTYTDTRLDISGSTVKYGNAEIKGGKLYYTPMTTKWDGYDTFYVFWHSNSDDVNAGAGDAETGYGWSKVSVIPANNVYYEDTFVSNTSTGKVGIVFSGDWNYSTAEGSNTELPENSENAANANHGWVEDLSDDTGYSDGTVATANGSNNNATATFTFTGSGMDLYSRTDSTTGTIVVKVVPDDATAAKGAKNQYYIVDNLSASGTYYQIPTVSFAASVHGTYTVTIQVSNLAAKDGGRVTYYLDGIRIYNPLSNEQENDVIVDSGYGNETDAIFHEVRDLLLTGNEFTSAHTVSFNANGGSESVDPVTVDAAGKDVSSCPFIAPEGKQFKGWSLKADGDVLVGTEYVTADTTLYAIWEDKTDETPKAYELKLIGTSTIALSGAVLIDEVKAGQDATTGTPLATDVIGIYEDFGPKNEVYLQAGQSIVFKLDNVDTTKFDFYVGLKAPNLLAAGSDANGGAASVEFSNGTDNKATATIDHSTDMYYKLVPDAGGYVSIKNTSGGLLSITKLRITGDPDGGEVPTVAPITSGEAVSQASTFRLMRSVAYNAAAQEETQTETPAESEQPQVPEVDIDNPETTDEPSIEEEVKEKIEALVQRLFDSIRNWFNS